MATATFYRNSSDDRKLNKDLTQISSVTVQFKGDTSVIRPVIKVLNFSNATSCNYVYIQDFGRYYFVRGITVSQQHIYFELECDVLYTYKTAIRNTRAIIARQEKLCDYYLNDERFRAEEYIRTQTYTFPAGFTQNAFILSIAGGS